MQCCVQTAFLKLFSNVYGCVGSIPEGEERKAMKSSSPRAIFSSGINIKNSSSTPNSREVMSLQTPNQAQLANTVW